VRRYLLDTSVLVGHLVGRRRIVDLLSPWLAHDQVGTSILVYAEVVEYIKPRQDYFVLFRQLRRVLRDVHPYPLSTPILERYADLRLSMRRPAGPGLIGDIDTLIAATALERRLAVVATDGDYLRVPDLGVILLDRLTLTVISHRVS
jgi:predicted nucleic acid-binding protein